MLAVGDREGQITSSLASWDKDVYSWGLKCISWKHGLVIESSSDNICNRNFYLVYCSIAPRGWYVPQEGSARVVLFHWVIVLVLMMSKMELKMKERIRRQRPEKEHRSTAGPCTKAYLHT